MITNNEIATTKNNTSPSRLVRGIGSAAMGLLTLIALAFTLCSYDVPANSGFDPSLKKFSINGFTSMRMISGYSFIATILGILLILQMLFSLAAIAFSLYGVFKMENKRLDFISLMFQIVSMVWLFLYMLEGIISSSMAGSTEENVFTLAYIPFLIGILFLVACIYLRKKYPLPMTERKIFFAPFDETAPKKETCISNSQVSMYMMNINQAIPNEYLLPLKQKISRVDEATLTTLMCVPVKNPTTVLLLSIFLGGFGVDRFYLGDTVMGVCKLLFGVFTFGIWAIADIFICHKKVKEINLQNIVNVLEG